MCSETVFDTANSRCHANPPSNRVLFHRRCNDSLVAPPGQFTRLAGYRLSFEPISTNRLVKKTRPAICTHSERMLPTTWPHLLSTFIHANRKAQPTPVITMNIRSECRCKKSSHAERFLPLTGRLSADPISYKNFVPRM